MNIITFISFVSGTVLGIVLMCLMATASDKK